MACNVCGEKVGVCENGECLAELDGDFKCYKNVHFCSERCWEIWLVDEEIGSVEEAEDNDT